jgi:hypothetical protein
MYLVDEIAQDALMYTAPMLDNDDKYYYITLPSWVKRFVGKSSLSDIADPTIITENFEPGIRSYVASHYGDSATINTTAEKFSAAFFPNSAPFANLFDSAIAFLTPIFLSFTHTLPTHPATLRLIVRLIMDHACTLSLSLVKSHLAARTLLASRLTSEPPASPDSDDVIGSDEAPAVAAADQWYIDDAESDLMES